MFADESRRRNGPESPFGDECGQLLGGMLESPIPVNDDDYGRSSVAVQVVHAGQSRRGRVTAVDRNGEQDDMRGGKGRFRYWRVCEVEGPDRNLGGASRFGRSRVSIRRRNGLGDGSNDPARGACRGEIDGVDRFR